MIWLIEKVKKDNSQNHGFKSFKEFLDKQQYSSRGILLYEKIFGRTFVSTGGIETTKVSYLTESTLVCVEELN